MEINNSNQGKEFFCQKCGAKLEKPNDKNFVFCTECGARCDFENEKTVTVPDKPKQQNKRKLNRKIIALIIVAAIVLTAGITTILIYRSVNHLDVKYTYQYSSYRKYIAKFISVDTVGVEEYTRDYWDGENGEKIFGEYYLTDSFAFSTVESSEDFQWIGDSYAAFSWNGYTFIKSV